MSGSNFSTLKKLDPLKTGFTIFNITLRSFLFILNFAVCYAVPANRSQQEDKGWSWYEFWPSCRLSLASLSEDKYLEVADEGRRVSLVPNFYIKETRNVSLLFPEIPCMCRTFYNE